MTLIWSASFPFHVQALHLSPFTLNEQLDR